jgi:CRP/FNR family cyclic AMP-dependent transcriptional regulator
MRPPPDTGTTFVRVLNEDPDLASAIDPSRLLAARLKTVAPLIRLDQGKWEAPTEERDPARDLGLLVLDGLLFRNLEIAGRTFSEVRGPEDLLRPWDDAADLASIRGRITWTIAEPTRLAWLDGEFAAVA